MYPAEIFPVRVRTTCHGIAAAAGKIGAFIGTYALAALLPEPKGASLEDLSEQPYPASAVALGVAESRGTRTPSA